LRRSVHVPEHRDDDDRAGPAQDRTSRHGPEAPSRDKLLGPNILIWDWEFGPGGAIVAIARRFRGDEWVLQLFGVRVRYI